MGAMPAKQTIVTLDDLLILKEALWPTIMVGGRERRLMFTDYQLDILDSSLRNDETYVKAGNQLGKDFIAGFLALGSFIVCYSKGASCRIVSTSVAEKHLDILWGEITRFAMSAKRPLLYPTGPLVLKSMEIVRADEADKAAEPYNYLKGIVYENPDKMAGHHADFTLGIGDEASGLDDVLYDRFQGWAKLMLFIGNPNNCANFFKRNIKAGDLAA